MFKYILTYHILMPSVGTAQQGRIISREYAFRSFRKSHAVKTVKSILQKLKKEDVYIQDGGKICALVLILKVLFLKVRIEIE